MADIQDSNITPLRAKADRTVAERQAERRQKAAERQRRSRERRKQAAPPVTRDQSVTRHTPPVTGRETPATMDKASAKRDAVTVSTFTAALPLAAVSAGFSITGMTAVFVGATLPVIGMGVALELGKLSAVAWLGRYGGKPALRAALAVLVVILMGLNAIGCFGYLSKAHIGHAVAGETAVAGRAADIEARISMQTGVVGDLDRRIAQIDGAVEKATSKGRTASAMALADSERKTRTEFVAQRTSEAKTLAVLQVEKASIEGQRRVAEADLGPVRYLAALLRQADEVVLRYFILIVALLLDPAAVLLLLAASSARR